MFKGAGKGEEPVMLRSYDSRKESSPEFECTIWQAGRATSAVGLAFKPIQIGQAVFHDDGGGTFNPSPEALEEAAVNEWPGREIGVFLSVGTGKRPKGSDANQTMWYEGFLGEFAEARRKLIAKIEGCEKIHEHMKKELLLQRGVNVENYYRLNVEIGVGEFGMNEWNRLSEISTGTRRYLNKPEERQMVQSAATKLAKIHKANIRWNQAGHGVSVDVPELIKTGPSDISSPLAVELPAEIPTDWPAHNTPPSRQSYESGQDLLNVHNQSTPSPRSSNERIRPGPGHPPAVPPRSSAASTPPRSSPGTPPRPPPGAQGRPMNPKFDDDHLAVQAPTPAQWRNASGQDKIAITGMDEHPRRQYNNVPIISHNAQHATRIEPPPLPPKTPLQDNQLRRPVGPAPPYPMDDDAPPPPVNMAKKPEYRSR